MERLIWMLVIFEIFSVLLLCLWWFHGCIHFEFLVIVSIGCYKCEFVEFFILVELLEVLHSVMVKCIFYYKWVSFMMGVGDELCWDGDGFMCDDVVWCEEDGFYFWQGKVEDWNWNGPKTEVGKNRRMEVETRCQRVEVAPCPLKRARHLMPRSVLISRQKLCRSSWPLGLLEQIGHLALFWVADTTMGSRLVVGR